MSKRNKKINLEGVKGLPEHYPIPRVENMLFYIQRNQNENTVIYRLNLDKNGQIDKTNPFYIYWKQYNNKRSDQEINFIQRELAYGIKYEFVNEEVIKLHIVSYPSYDIYVSKNKDGRFVATSKINGNWAELSNVYVFAEESGAFPLVWYIELYGIQIQDQMPCFEKILI